MMQVVIFSASSTRSSAVHQAQCDAPLQVGHRKCGCWRWRLVSQLRFRRCWRVKHGRVVFVDRHFRHGPFHGVFKNKLWFDVLCEELVVGVECRGLRHGIADLAVAACAQVMPSSCPHLVLLAQVRDSARCPSGQRLAPPCFVHAHVVEGAVEDTAGQRRGRLRLDAALEAAGRAASRTC